MAALWLCGCSANSGGANVNSNVNSSDSGKETPVGHLHAFISKFEAKAEHTDPTVKVQHILIAFKGSLPDPSVKRSKQEAEELTGKLLQEIEGGADFDALVKKYTNDSHPGIYTMTLKGKTDQAAGIYSRYGMVPAFGNTGWRLKAGEIGIAQFDTGKSPYGWHIVKRLE